MADPFAQFMLVCEQKTNGRKLVPNGVSILEDMALMTILSQHPDIRMTTKAITPGKTTFEIYKADLIVNECAGQQDAVRGAVSDQASEKTKTADEVPWKYFLGHEWEGHSFDEITILFTTNSAASTIKTQVKTAQHGGNDGAGNEL